VNEALAFRPLSFFCILATDTTKKGATPMQEVTTVPKNGLLYVYAPMCGTCAIAERMLAIVEATESGHSIQEANGNFIPDFLEYARVLSVPALLRIEENQVVERLYAFQSVQNVFAFCQER
jgi:hypothetical protein